MDLGIVTSKIRRASGHGRTTIDGVPMLIRKGNIWFVDGSKAGSAGTSWDSSMSTMAKAFAKVGSGDTIYFTGKITEQLVSPVNVFDVRIIGTGTRPRHSDSMLGGHTSEAHWASAGLVAAQANLRILQQGWHVENIMFSMIDADAAGIEVVRNAGSGDAERDASHASIVGNRFSGAGVGVRGGATSFAEVCNHVLIEGNRFDTNTFGIKTAIISNYWSIRSNEFRNATNAITADLGYGFIYDNIIVGFTASGNSGGIDLRGSSAGLNVVTRNHLSGTYSHAGGYFEADSTDEWAGNTNVLTGGITAALPG